MYTSTPSVPATVSWSRAPSPASLPTRRPTTHIVSAASTPANAIRPRLCSVSRRGKPGTLLRSTQSANTAARR